MKTKDPIFVQAYDAASAMHDLEMHRRRVRSHEDAAASLLRGLLEAVAAEVPKDRLMEFGERFYHHVRAIGGGYLDQNFSYTLTDQGDKIVEGFDAALKAMGTRRGAKKLEL